ncbi:hypothetical protein [Arthrobacter sp. efr-133-TYG-118]|uniref:hypothetical protein n=1 Tax=Arthrobacter sp. efr-133-TYG-118 TaxID=3040279 RepID=UPI0025515B17|nr:hypothetical protein [Arthrobacter sp. efr-133-TYG-118]
MAISAVPFALQNVPINSDVVREAVSSLLPNSGGIVQSGDFPVAQTTVASMAVTVGVGRAWIQGTDVAFLSGQSYGKQASYYVMNDASVTLSIDAADSTNPRIDVVYIAIQDATYSGTNNAAVLAVAKGFPTSGAAYPANAPTLPNNAIALAWINVAAGASSIVTANITTVALLGIMSRPPLGIMPGRVKVTANGAGLTTLAVQNNIGSFAFKGGRKYKIVWQGGHSFSSAGDYFNLAIQTCSTADAANATTGLTTIQGRTYTTNSAGLGESFYVEAIYEPATDTTLQVKFTVARAIGSGTWTLQASSGAPAWAYIEDQGAQY